MTDHTDGRRLLVTGGAGFIGSNFVRYILGCRPIDQVTVLDKLTYAGNRDTVRELEGDARYQERFRFVQGDIADAAVVAPLIAASDLIVNFAAETHVDRSIVDPTAFLQTNVVGTQVLLDLATRATPRPRLFLQVSTDEVYGSTTPEHPFTETSMLHPSSPYAASKASADLLVAAYKTTFGLPVVITRSSNNYGPYQYPEKFIPLAITNALENESVPLYGDGLNVRDWIYVEDNCHAIATILDYAVQRDMRQAEIFNIGAGETRTNRSVLQDILLILGKPASLIRPVTDRPGHDRGYALSIEKLRRQSREVLGHAWAPEHTFAQGLHQTIEWYREHPAWWKPLKQRAGVHWLPPTMAAKS